MLALCLMLLLSYYYAGIIGSSLLPIGCKLSAVQVTAELEYFLHSLKILVICFTGLGA